LYKIKGTKVDAPCKKKIGQILCEMGYLSLAQLAQGLVEQKKSDNRLLGEILLELGFITQAQLDEALAVKV
jgi:type IV pilus assembly protein PilB